MFLYNQILLKIVFPILLLSLLILWCLTTESGLRTAMQLSESFIPGRIRIQNVSGNLWTHVKFMDIQWEHPNFILTADTLSFTPNLKTLIENRIYLENIDLNKATITIRDHVKLNMAPISIQTHSVAIELTPVIGNKTFKLINPGHVEISSENHALQWTEVSKNTPAILWKLSSRPLEHLSIESNGLLKFDDFRRIAGQINHLALNFHSRTIGNLIFSNIDIHNFNIIELLSNRHLSGRVTANIANLNAISILFPVIARPKGEVNASLTVQGTLNKPSLMLEATLHNGKFYLPKDRIKINDIYLNIHGNLLETITLTGFGHAGEGQFKVSGTIAPFLPHMPNQLTLKGKNLQLHDTANMFITASPDVQLRYEDNAFFLNGLLEIPKGAIIEREDVNIVHSRDVVFTDPIRVSEKGPNSVEFYPNIQLIIDEGFRYVGHKLDLVLKGKVRITKRDDGLYTGDGRLTIVEGQYRLDSGVQYTKQGRLMFVTGTLLNDPLLDIKMSPKNNASKRENIEDNIYVYGTLKNPHVQLFETTQKTFGALAKIGLSSNVPQTDRQRQLENRLLAGSNPIIDSLKQNIGVEFGFETKEVQRNLNSPLSKTTTVFVIGKPLTENFSFQVLTGIRGEHINSARLKYSFNDNWDTSIEHGTDGTGADITFSLQCD